MFITSSFTDPRVVATLAAGGIGVLPTDTIYGIIAPAGDKRAVARLYEIKKREGKPGTVIAASEAQLIELGLDARIVSEVAHLWPNPISIVVPVDPELDYLDLGLKSIAVRIPADQTVRDFLLQVGPLLTSSANHPGQAPSFNVKQAREYFGEEVDFYVDGGERRGLASTVVRYQNGRFETLRQGPIAVDSQGYPAKSDIQA
ncbi:L-threonylcarbamoyladenylate synthase [Candidatus Saccharibacteria bacterium]|nr:L-threonylcarbamoyladenylate synthase [Candidatus Saccharibacteria bacterium]